MSEYLKYRFEKICEEMRQFRIRGEQETEIKGTMKEVFQERSTVLKVLHSCDLAFFTSTFSFFFFFYYWCFLPVYADPDFFVVIKNFN